MAFTAANIRTLITTDFLVRCESDVATIVTDTKIGMSQRDLLSLVTQSAYDDYIAGTLSSFDEDTFDYALCCLVISQLMFSEFEVVQSIVKATIHQYGDGKLTPSKTEDIKKMSDWWVTRAKQMIKSYNTPSLVGQPAISQTAPPIWRSGDSWS